MAQGYVTDDLSVAHHRTQVNDRLTAIEKKQAKTTQGYLLPTANITYFDAQLSVYTTSTSFVTALEGQIQQLVRPAILLGFPVVMIGGWGGGVLGNGNYASPLGATGQYRLRLKNSAGVDVGNSPSAVRSLLFGYTYADGWFWNHGVELWQAETYSLSVEARVTSAGVGDLVKIAMPIHGFDQTGLTIPGSLDTLPSFVSNCPTAKGSIYEALGFDCFSSSGTFRATTNGKGS